MLPQVNKLQESIDGWNSILADYEHTNKFAQDCAAGVDCTWEPPPAPGPPTPLYSWSMNPTGLNQAVVENLPEGLINQYGIMDWIVEGISSFLEFDDLEDPSFQLAHSDTLGKVK